MLFRIMLFQIDKSDVFNYLTVVLYVFHLGKKNSQCSKLPFPEMSVVTFCSIYNHFMLSDLSVAFNDNLLFLVLQMVIPLCCSS